MTHVERVSAGLVISAGAHAAVILLVVLRVSLEDEDPARPVAAAVAVEIVEPRIADEAITEVVLDETPVPQTAVTAPAKRATKTSRKAIATTSATGTVETPGTVDAPPTTNILAMRKPDVPTGNLRLSDDYLDRVAVGTPGTPPPAVETTGKLKPAAGGRHKSDEGTFTVKVDKDGTVDIRDRSSVKVTQRPRWGKPKTWLPVIAGAFDITDAAMRKTGNDPYFSKKLKYLDQTRDERVELGTRYKQQQLRQSGELMQKSLAQLPQDAVARRRALFELWDDCAETGEPAVVEGGRQARALVIGYIRGKHGKASALAFTPNEIAAFNKQRQSKAVFAPYD
jgi:hypothetical protein